MLKVCTPMGRSITGLQIDKIPSMINVKSNGTNNREVHIAPKALLEKVEMKDDETYDHNQMQDVLGIKSTIHAPEEKIIKAESQKSIKKKLTSPIKPASGSTINGTADANSSESVTPSVDDGKRTSLSDYVNGTETNDPDSNISSQYEDITSKNPKKSQPISPMSAKQRIPHHKYYDDDDNWSLTSSTATSVRTNKSKITVPVAPRFTCVNRLERRKEYYIKLEEKHKALEKEKLEYESRTKEEEAAAIKQLRKNMAYKANPVPSFYREGPTPKPELKKLPVTRAKSPNFTLSRRKSYGDAVRASSEDKGIQGRALRRSSVGSLREYKNSPITPKGKDRLGRKLNETSKNKDQSKNKSKELKQATENPKVKVNDDAGNVVVES